MATSTSIPDTTPTQTSGGLLVLLTALPHEQIESVLEKLRASLPAEQLVIATAEEFVPGSHSDLRIVPATSKSAAWSLTAEDFVQAHELATKHEASAVLILGPESGSLEGQVLRNLSAAIVESQAGLSVPYYDLSPRAGLLNSAILYPLSRSLFASRVRYPLAIDLGMSLPMLERLAMAGQRYTNLNQPGALVWPVNEACVAGITVAEVPGGPRALPQPAQPDLSVILPQITGSFFADIEKKWGR
jgi:glucosylglycerate synthase